MSRAAWLVLSTVAALGYIGAALDRRRWARRLHTTAAERDGYWQELQNARALLARRGCSADHVTRSELIQAIHARDQAEGKLDQLLHRGDADVHWTKLNAALGRLSAGADEQTRRYLAELVDAVEALVMWEARA